MSLKHAILINDFCSPRGLIVRHLDLRRGRAPLAH
jgi:hypothetical protein